MTVHMCVRVAAFGLDLVRYDVHDVCAIACAFVRALSQFLLCESVYIFDMGHVLHTEKKKFAARNGKHFAVY